MLEHSQTTAKLSEPMNVKAVQSNQVELRLSCGDNVPRREPKTKETDVNNNRRKLFTKTW